MWNQEKRARAEKIFLNENIETKERGLVLQAVIVAVPDPAVQFDREDREAQVVIVATKSIDQKSQEARSSKNEYQEGKARVKEAAEKSRPICLRRRKQLAIQAQLAI